MPYAPGSIVGVGQFIQALGGLTAKMKAKAQQNVNRAALYVEREAKLRTPVLTSTLVNSAQTMPAQIDGDRIVAHVSFNTFYALYVHEILRYHHPVGQAKYLSSVLSEKKAEIAKLLTRGLI